MGAESTLDDTFQRLTGLSWYATRGWGSEREVRTQVFVFAIQTCEVPADYDPVDVGP